MDTDIFGPPHFMDSIFRVKPHSVDTTITVFMVSCIQSSR